MTVALQIDPDNWEWFNDELKNEMLSIDEWGTVKRLSISTEGSAWRLEFDQPGAARSVTFYPNNRDIGCTIESVRREIQIELGHDEFQFHKIGYENKAGSWVARYCFAISQDLASSIAPLFVEGKKGICAGWGENLQDEPPIKPMTPTPQRRNKIEQWKHVSDKVAEGARLGEEVLIQPADSSDSVAIRKINEATYFPCFDGIHVQTKGMKIASDYAAPIWLVPAPERDHSP